VFQFGILDARLACLEEGLSIARQYNTYGCGQGQIKGFVGPSTFRHFWIFEKYCWNYSVLSIIRANGRGGVAWIIRTFFLYLTVPLAGHRLRNVLFSHTSHFIRRLRVEFWFLKKKYIFLCLVFYFVLNFPILSLLYLYFSPFNASVGPKNVVGPRHSAYSA
jgi:hypothetical protein